MGPTAFSSFPWIQLLSYVGLSWNIDLKQNPPMCVCFSALNTNYRGKVVERFDSW